MILRDIASNFHSSFSLCCGWLLNDVKEDVETFEVFVKRFEFLKSFSVQKNCKKAFFKIYELKKAFASTIGHKSFSNIEKASLFFKLKLFSSETFSKACQPHQQQQKKTFFKSFLFNLRRRHSSTPPCRFFPFRISTSSLYYISRSNAHNKKYLN